MITDNLNLNQLRIFHAVARLLSFTLAAKELNLTQPGISKHIKDLETYYGTKLFSRLGKKVFLTQAGEILFRATGTIFNVMSESKTRIDDLRGLTVGKLSIGASITIGTYLLPDILSTFKQRHPGIEIKVDIALSQLAIDKVFSNDLEIGLVGYYPHDKRLIVTSFKKDRMVLIVSKQHPWAMRKSPVRIQDLADQPFLLSREGSATREIVMKFLEKKNIVPKNVMEFGTAEGVKKAVEVNLGVSILSTYVIARELAAGRIKAISLHGLNLNRDFSSVYRRDRYLSEAARAFLELLHGQ
jgi:DNA-binding transcriptional LysR family regulator